MGEGMRLQFEDFPDQSLTVLLFKNVTNSEQLRDLVLAASLQPDCSLANAALVPDLYVLHVAAYKALVAQQRQALRTKSLHAELVFNLSGSKHIAQTLTRFGISPECRHVLVARFNASPEDVEQLKSTVSGTLVPLSELAELADTESLAKHLKITADELSVGSIADAMLGRIASRDC